MPVNEEEDDLEFLRSAALASLGKKSRRHSESEDLEALRRQALTSRKKSRDNSEEAIFEKLQPVRSSNLINLTPDPGSEPKEKLTQVRDKTQKTSLSHSDHESESNESEDQQSSSSDSSEDESSESSEESDPSDEDKDEEPSKTTKDDNTTQPTEEDDILYAIDQLLDEGVVPQRDIVKPKKDDFSESKKHTKRKKTKGHDLQSYSSSAKNDSKSKKESHRTKVSSPKRTNKREKEEKPLIKKHEKLLKNKDDKPVAANWRRKPTNEDKTTVKKVITGQDMSTRKQSPVWKSADLPLHRNRVENLRNNRNRQMETDSVHSSDLSFLSDGDSDSKEIVEEPPPKPLQPQVKDRLGRTAKARMDNLKDHRASEASRSSSEERSQGSRERDGRPSVAVDREKRRDESSFPDLRDKLRRRGLHRPVSSDSPSRDSSTRRRRDLKCETENGHSKTRVSKRHKTRTTSNEAYKSNEDTSDMTRRTTSRNDDSERLIVTRKIGESTFSPITVRLAEDKERKKSDDGSNSFRRKRNVVQAKPEIPDVEKHKKVEVKEKKVETAQGQDTNYFSDLSEDFDDFEIDEPDENTIMDTVKIDPAEDADKSDEDSHPDTRRIISSPRAKMKKSRTKSRGSSDDERRSKRSDVSCRMRKRRIKPVFNEDANAHEEPIRVRSKIKPIREASSEKMNDKYQRDAPASRSRSRRAEAMNEPRERSMHWGSNSSSLGSRANWHREDRRGDLADRPREEKRFRTWSPPHPMRKDDGYRRRRRVDVSGKNAPSPGDWEAPSRDKPVKYRVGHSRGASPYEERKNNSYYPPRERRKKDEPFMHDDREKVVDARIRRINEKNAEILKRREMIEIEERRFRVKAT